MFMDIRYALPIARPYSSSLPFLRDVRCAMTIRIHIHTQYYCPSKSGFRQYLVIREPGFRRRVTLPKEKAEEPRHNLRRGSWDRDAKGYVQTRWDMYGTVTTVSLSGRDDDDGPQISFGDDHRWPGVARERLLSRFFFFSPLFSPLSPPVRWERKPDRGSLRPLSGSSCATSSSRMQRRERDGRRRMDREDRREPFELTNPV